MSSSFTVYTLGIMLTFSSIVMILLVLIQRGRGGGLAGAFGGQGGQSALGVRAGDIFTKITVVVAVVWVLLAGFLGISMRAKAANDLAGTTLNLAADEEAKGTDDKTDETGSSAPETLKATEPTDPANVDGPLVFPAASEADAAAETSTEEAKPEDSTEAPPVKAPATTDSADETAPDVAPKQEESTKADSE